ncbi:hypothetical protein TNCT_269311 [Trichonephila clavata]|uniref:Uncharacterized protein n=1 Tax=Trichonephila clavata TaxID=2740835 RepID=A0A8X6HZK1_TRICU|nr:hypothetical protein TNCT_269311 [Trichonephila clavata]
MAEKDIVTVLKKKRTQLRTAVTKLINTIEEEIEKPNINYEEVEVNIELLEDKFLHLSTTDAELIKYFKPVDADKEFISSEDYRDKVIRCKYKTAKCLKARVLKDSSYVFNSQSQSTDFNYKERQVTKIMYSEIFWRYL